MTSLEMQTRYALAEFDDESPDLQRAIRNALLLPCALLLAALGLAVSILTGAMAHTMTLMPTLLSLHAEPFLVAARIAPYAILTGALLGLAVSVSYFILPIRVRISFLRRIPFVGDAFIAYCTARIVSALLYGLQQRMRSADILCLTAMRFPLRSEARASLLRAQAEVENGATMADALRETGLLSGTAEVVLTHFEAYPPRDFIAALSRVYRMRWIESVLPAASVCLSAILSPALMAMFYAAIFVQR